MSDQWSFSYEFLPPLALSAHLPLSQVPTLGWIGQVVVVSLEILRNRLQWERVHGSEDAARALAGELDLSDLKLPPLKVLEFHRNQVDLESDDFQPVEAEADSDVSRDGLRAVAERHVAHSQVLGMATGLLGRGVFDPFAILNEITRAVIEEERVDPTSMEDYFAVYQTLPKPDGLRRDPDELLEWMLVTGPNPILIEAVAPGDPRLEGVPLDPKGLQEGRAFVVDLTMLEDLEYGDFPDGPKYSAAPRLWLMQPHDEDRLRLVGIQLAGDQPALLRGSIPDWPKARLFALSALATHHEMVAHLGQTHLLLDPLVVSLHRVLPHGHPVSRLLRPHFEGTIAINYAAHETLVAPKNIVDRLLPTKLSSSLKLAAWGLTSFGVDALALPEYLKSRGTMGAQITYPWRDDALLVWRAIEGFVGDFVEANYDDDAAVADDADLQAWHTEATSQQGGRLAGFASIQDRQRLVRVLTQVVFTASAGHWGVNQPQADLMACTAVFPVSAYRPVDEPFDLLKTMPPLDMANLQIESLSLLGGVVHSRLGRYPLGTFRSKAEREAVEAFRERLESVSATIQQRSAERWLPYRVLDPATLPRSINI